MAVADTKRGGTSIMRPIGYDTIGYWSEVKLDIIGKYASAYTTVLSNEPRIRGFAYIDAFAGAGEHISRTTGEVVPGSPLKALTVQPRFHEFHFIDLHGGRADNLRRLSSGEDNVFVYPGDCNSILLETVFPRVRYQDYRRALCILDPYGLHLDWNVMYTAGQMKSIEIFLNFSVMDMNMNVLKRDPSLADPQQLERMNRFWGDESWRAVAYTTEEDLFGYETKTGNEVMAQAFRERLRTAAGFSHVPDPMPMRNSTGATIYYLFFAAQKPVAGKIVTEIFKKYRDYGK